MAAAVLGMATVAIVGPIVTARQQTEAVAGVGAALALARQLMEEVAAKPYADPDDGNILLGPDAGETSRDLFDNVDDYHGYSDATKSLRSVDGDTVETVNATRAPAVAFARRVTVEYRAGPTGPSVAVGDFALITVSVKPVDEKGAAVAGEGVELSGLVTRVSLRK